MANSDETSIMKVKDLFDSDPLFTGRTEVDTTNKLNIGTVWSCPGINFIRRDDGDLWGYDSNSGKFHSNTSSILAVAPVFLPHGATITRVIVTGLDANSSNSWFLKRAVISTGAQDATLASGAINTESTSITSAVVDNLTYSYFFSCGDMDSADDIWGASVTYTI